MTNKKLDAFAKAESLKYFKGDELAADAFVEKYALRNIENDVIEVTPDDMHKRLAKEFLRIESMYPNPMTYDEIYQLFSNWKIVPQGSPMSGIGNSNQIQSLSNCFVIPSPLDSYGGICMTDQQLVQISKRRGGVGFDLSNIRPKGMPTTNAARTTDGIAGFMKRYSNSTREVGQGGRRGALMMTISCYHPEIETFIDIKTNQENVTGANISIRLTDEFMQAVENDDNFVLRWPVSATPETAKLTKTVKARKIWDQLALAVWKCGDPGVFFWDRMTKDSMADIFSDKGFETISTNPCGEIGLSKYDSCRLLLINLVKYVSDPFTSAAKFDFDAFEKDARKAQRLMDDLVDLELEAVNKIIEKVNCSNEPDEVSSVEERLWERIREAGVKGRRTGTGITALGDVFAYLNIGYGSDESLKLTEEIYKTLALATHRESVLMAKERGKFPVCDPKRYAESHPYLDRLKQYLLPEEIQDLVTYGRRNIALTTTAPAGTVSTMTQTTSGIEPVFLLEYGRRRKVNKDSAEKIDFVDDSGDSWQEYMVTHHGLQLWKDITGETDIKRSPYWGFTANEIPHLSAVKIQATAQQFCEHSLSKTINLPKSATSEQISETYMLAWKLGCKGITMYRDESKNGVLVSTENLSKNGSSDRQDASGILVGNAQKRPKELKCDLSRVNVKGETYLVIVGLLNDKPYEVFAGLSQHVEVPKKFKKGTIIKNGKNSDGVVTYNLEISVDDSEKDLLVFKDIVNLFDNPSYGSLTRMVSLSLRHGVPVNFIVEQLRKDKYSDITSFSTALAKVLSKSYVSDGTKYRLEKTCENCGSQDLQYMQGCMTCAACGVSKC
jgi:ribonucleoside-diphosphate reductase alpha chain